MTAEARRVRARFADDNPLLYLSLGLLSSFESLGRLLAVHAPERSLEAPVSAEGSETETAAVHFVLGLLALRARVEARLGEAAGPEGVPVSVATATTEERFEGRGGSLLR